MGNGFVRGDALPMRPLSNEMAKTAYRILSCQPLRVLLTKMRTSTQSQVSKILPSG